MSLDPRDLNTREKELVIAALGEVLESMGPEFFRLVLGTVISLTPQYSELEVEEVMALLLVWYGDNGHYNHDKVVSFMARLQMSRERINQLLALKDHIDNAGNN